MFLEKIGAGGGLGTDTPLGTRFAFALPALARATLALLPCRWFRCSCRL